jgi:hypothetical protein
MKIAALLGRNAQGCHAGLRETPALEQLQDGFVHSDLEEFQLVNCFAVDVLCPFV